jgi:hypothetical protein
VEDEQQEPTDTEHLPGPDGNQTDPFPLHIARM